MGPSNSSFSRKSSLSVGRKLKAATWYRLLMQFDELQKYGAQYMRN